MGISDWSSDVCSSDLGVRTWDVFIGPFSARGADAGSMPDEALASVEAALKREALSPELHWLRLVHSHAADGDSRCEALLDNELWTAGTPARSEEHTSELQSLMRISYAVFCLKK